MHNIQDSVFRLASHWNEATAGVVFLLGLLYTLQGFRFAPFLVPLACAGAGMFAGMQLAELVQMPPLLVGGIMAAIVLCITLANFRAGLLLAAGLTFGLLALYLGAQAGFKHEMLFGTAAVGLALGVASYWVYRRQLTLFVTTAQGGMLLIVGFVGITATMLPSLGYTFQDWADRLPFLVPMLMAMLWVLGFSVQANMMQGDMETGAGLDVA